MVRKKSARKHGKHISLILVEGATEMEFYQAVAKSQLDTKPIIFKDLNGNYNIHAKILDKAKQYSDDHPDDTFDIYVCIDRDRTATPAINEAYLIEKLEKSEDINFSFR